MTAEEDAKRWYSQEIDMYEALATKLKNLVQELLDIENINYWIVESRAKTVESFTQKFKRKNYTSPNEIEDLTGIRIIGYVTSDVQKICDLLMNSFDIDKQKIEDKSDTLGIDKVGYRSRHFIATLPNSRTSLGEFKKFKGIVFEIQVRTILQHAWAEIQHDRNYKYVGVLPNEIQRRFNLLAGSLELVDEQFEQLSNRIEQYSAEVVARTKTGNLDIPINSTSVIQYLTEKFGDILRKTSLTDDLSNEMVDELNSMDIKSLSDLDKIIPPNIERLPSGYHNYLGFIRMVLILSNPRKYFAEAWKGRFDLLDKEFLRCLLLFGLNIETLRDQIPYNTVLTDDGYLEVSYEN